MTSIPQRHQFELRPETAPTPSIQSSLRRFLAKNKAVLLVGSLGAIGWALALWPRDSWTPFNRYWILNRRTGEIRRAEMSSSSEPATSDSEWMEWARGQARG